MSRIIIALDDKNLGEGFATVIKRDPQTGGRRRGIMSLAAVADLLQEVFQFDAAQRSVKMLSRFDTGSLIAFGQNGSRWMAVTEIPPAEYYLVGGQDKSYHVQLPRLVVRVTNYGWPWFYWTPAAKLTPQTQLYPMLLSNVYGDGHVCLGNTGLKCKSTDDIPHFVRAVIEAPGNHMLIGQDATDALYQRLETKGWDKTIGKRYGITLASLISKEG